MSKVTAWLFAQRAAPQHCAARPAGHASTATAA